MPRNICGHHRFVSCGCIGGHEADRVGPALTCWALAIELPTIANEPMEAVDCGWPGAGKVLDWAHTELAARRKAAKRALVRDEATGAGIAGVGAACSGNDDDNNGNDDEDDEGRGR